MSGRLRKKKGCGSFQRPTLFVHFGRYSFEVGRPTVFIFSLQQVTTVSTFLVRKKVTPILTFYVVIKTFHFTFVENLFGETGPQVKPFRIRCFLFLWLHMLPYNPLIICLTYSVYRYNGSLFRYYITNIILGKNISVFSC